MTVPSVRIGIDADGVIYDWTESMRAYIHKASGRPRDTMPDPDQWNTWESWGMPKTEFFGWFERGVEAGEVWHTGYLEPGVLEVFQQFKADGHTIHIVTHRNKFPTGMANTCLWLEREGVPYDTLTFAADKTVVKTDIFIEDNVDNYLALEAAGVVPVLITRPWNINVSSSLGFTWPSSAFRRVDTFQEFGDVVAGYAAWREEFPLLGNERVSDYL